VAVDPLYEPLALNDLNESRPDISVNGSRKNGLCSDFSSARANLVRQKSADNDEMQLTVVF
jgi:hypothetical protein